MPGKLAFIFIAFILLAKPAACAEFNALGHWMFGWSAGNVYGQKSSVPKDVFQAVQRLRTQFGFKTGNLEGAVQLEMGKAEWGKAANGAALGADGTDVKIRYAWLDWALENGLKVRMGLQPLNMPSFVNGSPIYSEDTAAIAISAPIGKNMDATCFWGRASAENQNNRHIAPACGTLDFFGLALPAKGENFKIAPYGMYANAGVNSFGYGVKSGSEWTLRPYKSSLGTVLTNLTPVGGRKISANPRLAEQLNQWASAYWLGLGGKASIWEDLTLAAEFAWGSSNFGCVEIDGREFSMRRSGWYGAALAEYDLEWAVPGILGWYSSGDDGNPWNGSERMPVGKSSNRDWKVLSIAYDGAPFCPAGGAQIISENGTMIGSWGIVGRIRDISFHKNLKHTLRGGYVRGTNSPIMIGENQFFTASEPGGYLTGQDEALEIDFLTHFKIYENLTLILDADWLRINWGQKTREKCGGDLIRDFYRIGFTAYFHF